MFGLELHMYYLSIHLYFFKTVKLQGPGYKKNYQINLKSNSGPINVLLVNKDTDSSSPVVVQVPPPNEHQAAQAIAAAQAAQNQNYNPNPSGKQRQFAKVVYQGPIVQSIISLTTLRCQLVKYMLNTLSNMLLFYVAKM